MFARNVLAAKGNHVALIGTEATVSAALDELARHDIGALVVSDDGDHVEGILSEREVARGLSEHGRDLLDWSVGEVMTRDVATCRLDDTIADLMAVMTERRTRHIPVVADERIVGIVSIGDAVKSRVDELETLHDQMVNYIQGH